MKKILITSLIFSIVLMFTGIGTIFAEEKKAEKATTVTGEIVDTYCYALMGAKGASHKKCATECLKKGIAAGLLEDGKDKLYILLPNKDETPLPKSVIEKAGEKVTVKGTVYTSGGVTFLTVDSVK